MTNLFQLSEPQSFDEGYAAGDDECSCPNPDDQYLLEIDNGAVFLAHRACGKQPRGDYMDLVEMARIPVTIKVEPYGSCDGNEWHGEYRCDCGIALVVTVNGLAVVHDDVPYLVGRDYRDRDGAVWHITSDRDRQGRPLVFLLPQGAGEDCPLEEIVADFGPLELVMPE
ncbi:phiSA1p31-related protein (plasmid) [Streptomyces sp. NBC_01005]|uniref:phiSA1p31-related protein n=1 Tax=Streptomyces sp. NBC_01005 TaxID=2903715 RepID=UPI002F90AF04|nr:phiSA1p31-related protein [Streptomyces sp. NBC_01005]